MNRPVPILALTLGLWLAAAAAGAAPKPALQGTVTRVVDGDSLWVTPAAGAAVEVRVQGIDAPEICQTWGPESRAALREMLQGKAVTVTGSARDAYGRLVATVRLEGVDAGLRQVEEGHAWSLRYKWDQGPYVKHERMAKALRRGLHGDPGAVPPRDFRASHGPCKAGG